MITRLRLQRTSFPRRLLSSSAFYVTIIAFVGVITCAAQDFPDSFVAIKDPHFRVVMADAAHVTCKAEFTSSPNCKDIGIVVIYVSPGYSTEKHVSNFIKSIKREVTGAGGVMIICFLNDVAAADSFIRGEKDNSKWMSSMKASFLYDSQKKTQKLKVFKNAFTWDELAAFILEAGK